jgi:hypothetical protein
MTRISKKNLPPSIRSARNKQIVGFTFVAVTIIPLFSYIGYNIGLRINAYLDARDETDYTFQPPVPIPRSFIYSRFGYDKNEDDAAHGKDTDIWGESFNQGRPEIGKISQITWKEDDSIVTPNVGCILNTSGCYDDVLFMFTLLLNHCSSSCYLLLLSNTPGV